jgi:glycerophosphoryl diester phosphodiesterase
LSSAEGVHLEHPMLTQQTIARWHHAQRAVAAWTVNKPAEAERLVRLGVDAIITDRPAEMREIVGLGGQTA